MELQQEQLDELKALAKSDLYIFAKGVLGFDWLVPHIHRPLCRLLELYDGYNKSLRASREEYVEVLKECFKRMGKDVTEDELNDFLDKGVKRLMIVIPRGWLKTTLCSQAYPIWRAVRNCNYHSLLAQNTYTNACTKLNVIDDAFKSNQLFRLLFSEILPDKTCQWKTDSKCIKRTKAIAESTFEACGTRTSITSRHYDEIIEDDTVAPEKEDLMEANVMPTQKGVEQAIGWHRLTLPLLNNPTKDRLLIVATRWFIKDLVSWVADNEDYVIYQRASREDEDGKPDENGTVTYPERFDEKVLSSLKDALGPYLFSCLFFNKPVRSQDMVFQNEWIQYYETVPQSLVCYTTVDPAGDPEDTMGEPDYNVVLTCGKDIYTGVVYLLEYTRAKMNPGELLNSIFNHVRKYSPVKVGLETVQYQKQLMYFLREKMRKENLYFTIEKLTHTKHSKNQRILGLQPVVQSGAILFRSHMKELISEMLTFPLGAHDDALDALASQLELWQGTVSVNESKKEEVDRGVLSFVLAQQRLQKENSEKFFARREKVAFRQNLRKRMIV